MCKNRKSFDVKQVLALLCACFFAALEGETDALHLTTHGGMHFGDADFGPEQTGEVFKEAVDDAATNVFEEVRGLHHFFFYGTVDFNVVEGVLNAVALPGQGDIGLQRQVDAKGVADDLFFFKTAVVGVKDHLIEVDGGYWLDFHSYWF